MLLGQVLDEIDDYTEFAAQRSARLRTADKDIAPYVRDDLVRSDWDDTINAASQLWLEIYNNLAPDGTGQDELEAFQKNLGDALGKTKIGDDGPDQPQLERITKYVGTATVNDATVEGTRAAGGSEIRWVTMHDDHVRQSHVRADGQTTPIDQPFDVGGARLRYPGDPSGPIEEVINCRCYVAPVGALSRRNLMAAAPPVVDETDLDAETEVDDTENEDLVDDTVEIPWHATLAPEERATGDGRMFAKDAISFRDMPLPLLYQHETGVSHAGSVRVGRMDEAWKTPDGEARARGVFNGTAEAQAVIQGIMDGSIKGVSVDVDEMELDFDRSVENIDDVNGGTMVFSKARIAGLTIVAIPAYQEAYIALGEAFDDELSPEDTAALEACGCGGGLWDVDDDEDHYVSEAAWDGSPANYTDEQYYAACIIHKNGTSTAKSDNSLPILTPSGELSRAGVHAAASRVDQVDAPPAAISAAKSKLRGAYKTLNEDPPDSLTAAVGTKDGPGWITAPKATARLRRYWTKGEGAAKIRWGAPGDFNRCRKQLAKYVRNPEWLAGTCANMHKEAMGIWPSTHAGKRDGRHSTNLAAGPAVTLTAGGATTVDVNYFTDPQLDGPTPITIDGDRIYGHLATWGTCHIGIQNVCTTAPHSIANYAYFRTGAYLADDGVIPVGQITMGTGHASLSMNSKLAAAHYDNTGSVVADVAAGEDSYGIWLAGALRPGLDDDQVRTLAAAALSGDWREIGGNLELVAALAVNVPGFPVPRVGLAASAGEQVALVAAGVVERDTAGHDRAGEIAAIVRTAVEEYRHQEARAQKVAERISPVRDRVHALRAADVRQKFEVI